MHITTKHLMVNLQLFSSDKMTEMQCNKLCCIREAEIILKFIRKTFPTEIKFDRKISNLIRIFFTIVRFPSLVKFQER